MGILAKIFGGKDTDDDFEIPPCPHTSLAQRWNNPDDMGNRELATYECTSCGSLFSYEEVRTILEPGEPGRELDTAGTSRSRGE
jgi:hypothetical protein